MLYIVEDLDNVGHQLLLVFDVKLHELRASPQSRHH